MELLNMLAPGGQRGTGQTKRIKQWVRQNWSLPQALTVMVSELQCAEPGCAPRETIIAIFNAGGVSHQSKLHKALTEVTEKDIQELPSPQL